ncbi:prolipoprotein diacylglyceryl transferase [Geminocystis sp. NIES-3708]|uniref:prolipoprotein diacylglyceryl transferase n=1 Tax=Geminocystis sp. NIES-3708 TaxID=1615909 RepID=UPI0005FC82F3|nr:prolipoprotein diacylglyceryl transferase [Geminocystis sp. NIES-3708]BAQ60161.1 prolipoprotein diacylglyceryl transferase [Geminocystis sp. NIES-3708]
MINFFAFQFQSPGPILFEMGFISLRWYGFLIASAVVIGVIIAQKLGEYRNINPDLISDLVIWLVIGAIPAARIYYVLFEWENYAQHPQDIIAIWQGGIAIHGAIIGGVIAALIFSKINHQSFWELTDVIAPSLILGQAIGRWGNFFNSEAFGIPTNVPWKLYIPPQNRPFEYIDFNYFHPTFLYESLWNIGVFILLISIFFWNIKHNNNLKNGTISLVYLIAYSLGRVWIEGFRTDSLMVGFLRIAQIVSLSAITFGIFGLIWLYIFKKSLPDTKV